MTKKNRIFPSSRAINGEWMGEKESMRSQPGGACALGKQGFDRILLHPDSDIISGRRVRCTFIQPRRVGGGDIRLGKSDRMTARPAARRATGRGGGEAPVWQFFFSLALCECPVSRSVMILYVRWGLFQTLDIKWSVEVILDASKFYFWALRSPEKGLLGKDLALVIDNARHHGPLACPDMNFKTTRTPGRTISNSNSAFL